MTACRRQVSIEPAHPSTCRCAVLNADARKASFSVSAYMLELYQDDLCDLLRPADPSRKGGEVGLLNSSSSLMCDRVYSL